MIVFSHRPLLAGKKRPATSEKNVPSVCFQLDCLLFFFFTMGKRAGWSVPYLTCHHVTSVSLSLIPSLSHYLSVQPTAPFTQWSPSQSHPGCHLQPACVSPGSVLGEACAAAAAGSAGCDDLDMVRKMGERL